ncbi:MAG: orotidine-5'-phosphate decarboxylase [Gammaproteobacteria bacterium]|nr:orotidine-5'-phosphate decarboxylase [bacterium AH-315-E07]PCH60589.1 MAG: orotidine-5'-phosphate decarboxylase [Gammaproteobacteria bacterium]
MFNAELPKVVVALDFASEVAANTFVDKIDPSLCRVKVGKELFTAAGPDFVRSLVKRGFDVFLDLKYHDIPNTTAAACCAAADLGVWMINVHAFGGSRMLEAASNALAKRSTRPLLIGVTVLTSMDSSDLKEIGISGELKDTAFRLAQLSVDCGLEGVVCSAQEASELRAMYGAEFRLVCPGIRPTGSAGDDQRRVVTPAEAVLAGASDLVIGRPVTQAEHPIAVLQGVLSEISDILSV